MVNHASIPIVKQESIYKAETYQLDPIKASRELARQLDAEDIGFILFFCSSAYELSALAPAMDDAFAGISVMGCTTAGEITSQGYSESSISALGFSRDLFTICGTRVPLSDFDLQKAQHCVNSLVSCCSRDQKAPINDNTFVLTLIDGLSPSEENFLVTLDTALGGIPHFGGSAGDDQNLANTHVYHQGQFYSESAIVVMFNTLCPFEVFTTHHIESLDSKLVVTRADCEHRRVYEFNAEPAAVVYAREIGVSLEDLKPQVYATNPLAVMIGDQYFVRSIQKVNDDLSLDFYCAMDDGVVVTAMRPGDIFANLSKTLDSAIERLGSIEVTLGCDCFLRRLEIEHNMALASARSALRDYRIVGFNTYGEQLNGIHMNQTLTGVVIGEPSDVGDSSSVLTDTALRAG
ncbi:nitric oxide-sensing protein NosP [Veronia pacifica]|uniref:GfdT protein n=1 Tax=Veronia pacifica TaxID=1080227 RepID=A0A1C3EQ16_9GAMM|nr:nitric oxide-sensing protein NosP [Veronia pacifica]ODA35289.1 GfdT protein [Veronia pacifica]